MLACSLAGWENIFSFFRCFGVSEAFEAPREKKKKKKKKEKKKKKKKEEEEEEER